MAYLFNADFETKLASKQFTQFESSKINQEFEYLIHWIDPQKTIFTTKEYDSAYTEYLSDFTKESFKTQKNGTAHFFCQDFKNPELKLKLNNKFDVADFLIKKKLSGYPLEYITSEKELTSGKIYKSPFGVSGSGHYFYPKDQQQILRILDNQGRVLKEPLIERTKDFSFLLENGQVLASYENYIDERFQYKGSYFSNRPTLNTRHQLEYGEFFNALSLFTENYTGPMSVDGFLFDQNKKLHPCCEINARKTMGFAAFKIWKKYFYSFSHFKFLLFKNEFRAEVLQGFLKVNKNDAVMLSPPTNRFLIFCLKAMNSNEMLEQEKKLTSTLFDRF